MAYLKHSQKNKKRKSTQKTHDPIRNKISEQVV